MNAKHTITPDKIYQFKGFSDADISRVRYYLEHSTVAFVKSTNARVSIKKTLPPEYVEVTP